MVKQITHQELDIWKANKKEFLLIDVREEEERAAFHIGGAWVPLAEVISKATKLPKDKPIVFYCRKGIRSQIAIQRLSYKMDTSQFYNLVGGITHLEKRLQ